ncbi:tyrosinase family protein [uncultured Psychroserpens sp.]|uniref:tyrosinase family protein n=1 Tax=uncultured Psychroserpens sp. TaxID=255436 RepID=UPI002632BBDE|nr:tyrosinase family protein [uncultured Psychroserpens sp.]
MKFILKINGSESEKAGYVGWTPVKCTLTIKDYNGDSPIPVTITPKHRRGKSGRIELYRNNAPSTMPVNKIEHDFKSENSLTFYVAGKFKYASIAEKDTYIHVQSNNSNLELKKDLMVRVRKNANKLTQTEIDLFLKAFVSLNNVKSSEDYKGRYTIKPSKLLHEIVLMHTYDAAFEIHSRESFHPWHRAYLMHLEREMQNLIPEVTVPYWKYDEKAEKVFTESFIGKTEKWNPNDPNGPFAKSMPKFSATNPMFSYKDHTVWGPLTRAYKETNPAIGKSNSKIADESDVIRHSDEFIKWCKYEERRSHNQAHNAFNGRVVDIGKDPVDPLFFLMHSNVDRLWALWQNTYNRYNHENIKTYPMPYAFNGERGDEWADGNPKKFDKRASFYMVNSYDLGNFADDELWPWGLYEERKKDSIKDETKDSVDRLSRPWRKYSVSNYGSAIVPELFLKFPKSAVTSYPKGPPKVKDTIDYQGRVDQKSYLGFDYDNIPYFDKDQPPKKKPRPISRDKYNSDFLNNNLSKKKRLVAAKNAFLFSDKDQDEALEITENKDVNIDIQLEAVKLIDESRVEFLDTSLRIIKNKGNVHDDKLRCALIEKIYAAKRANRSFASRRPYFFDILRGLLTSDKRVLRNLAIEILVSQEDAEVEAILLEQAKSYSRGSIKDSQQISEEDALLLLRYKHKNQHAKFFKNLAEKGNDIGVRKVAIAGLDNDLDSKEFLVNLIKDNSEDSSVRMASANALHHMDSDFMNDLAAKIIAKPESGDGIALFKSIKPDPDEVDFKTGLMNMLTYTGNINKLKKNKGLKSTLVELTKIDTKLKSNFRGSLELLTTADTKTSTRISSMPAIEHLALELLKNLDLNSEK